MPRMALDGAKLAADITRLVGEDKASPPATRPSLMDAVRELVPYIETRAKLGWTDPMIAVVLTEAGYPISAETLRSYRKRLRDEGLMAPLPAKRQEAKAEPRAATVRIPPPPITKAAPAAEAVKTPIAMVPDDTPPRAATAPSTEDAAVARAPPSLGTNSPPARTFRVDRTKLPPDRA